MTDDTPKQAERPEDLEAQIMDCRVPKSAAEWWAMREIERLRKAVANEREACAKLADLEAALCRGRAATFDKLTAKDRRLEDESMAEAYEDFAVTAESIARAIRFRSELEKAT